jgi:tripartite-type tricarboxylate transporter receptor subunit TctC
MTALRTTLMALSTVAAAALGGSLDASAQAYPNQVVRIVVPFSAGSITDGLARILADKLGDLWKQQVIVENRPGLPGTTAVAKSAPDGYTLMLTSNGHTIASAINKSIQYDPVKDCGCERKAGPAQLLVGGDCQHFVSVGRNSKAGCQDQHPARAL